MQARQPLSIDGQFDEPEWQAAAWSEPFLDIVGPTGARHALTAPPAVVHPRL